MPHFLKHQRFPSSFTAQACLTQIPCTLFCLVSLIWLFKVPCTRVSSMSHRLCSSLSPLSCYASRQVSVTDPQRVKKAALPQWSTTPPPFLHPFMAKMLHPSLVGGPGWSLHGGTDSRTEANRESRTDLLVRATAEGNVSPTAINLSRNTVQSCTIHIKMPLKII